MESHIAAERPAHGIDYQDSGDPASALLFNVQKLTLYGTVRSSSQHFLVGRDFYLPGRIACLTSDEPSSIMDWNVIL